ncbi:sigma-70 family RNA polymerase sigma factor [Virgibacillus flavescens]|uniref:sigma-70 family RNA polymerase sigma factor n=1 Tax=Virgibacillus flavescens TaxID=1611422 RepID=UPI003D33C037
MTKQYTFEEVFKQNERRIHYHIYKLNIHDPHQEFFQEGLCAMWNAYEAYKPDKGPLSTYFNFTIRNRLIDLIRKQNRYEEKVQTYLQENATEITSPSSTNFRNHILSENCLLWKQIHSKLNSNQLKWLHYVVMEGMSLRDLAAQENTTVDAVKGWSKEARRKLRNEEFRDRIMKAVNHQEYYTD